MVARFTGDFVEDGAPHLITLDLATGFIHLRDVVAGEEAVHGPFDTVREVEDWVGRTFENVQRID